MASPLTVEEHYRKDGVLDRVRAALAEAGLDSPARSWKEFAPLDQFHVRGMEATGELASRLDLSDKISLLDVGCGVGGPSRHLAGEHGASVTGIDLSESFIEVARYLSSLCDLDARVRFQVANALNLPFEDGSFDVVWTQHVAMNIADRPELYREMHRVLKPGGRVAIYDIVRGNGEPLLFPVPWAASPEISHLVSSDEMRTVLKEAGFVEEGWWDRTEEALGWISRQAGREPHSLGLHVIMGPEFPTMVGNLATNVKEGRVRLVQTVLRRE